MDVDTVTLALAAGMVAAVNPCGFALLPAYLSLLLVGDQPGRAVALGRAGQATAAMTAGFACVFALFGLAVAPVAASVQRYLPAFTIVLGAVVAAVGLWVLAGRKLPAARIGRRGAGRPLTGSLWSMTGFGISYAVASLGCTIAPFLAVVITAFRAGSTGRGMQLFVAYALGMGLVVGTCAVAVALAQDGLVGRLRRLGPVLPRVGGGLLVLAGGYVAWYGVWELRVLHSGAGADPVVETAANLQQWLAETVNTIGAVGFLAALAALLAAGFVWQRRTSDRGMATHPRGGDITMRAVWNGVVVAESDQTIVVEGNHYFPDDALRKEYFTLSTTTSICPWKGKASYYSITVDGQVNPDAAWQYQHPLLLARRVKNRVAFWHGVQVTPTLDESDANR